MDKGLRIVLSRPHESHSIRSTRSSRVICHGKWISSISQHLILNSLKRRPWRGDFDTNTPPIPAV